MLRASVYSSSRYPLRPPAGTHRGKQDGKGPTAGLTGSDLHNNRQDHGGALGLLIEVVGQVPLDRTLDGGPVGGIAGVHAVDGLQGHLAQLLHQPLGLLHIDEASGDQVGAGDQAAVLPRHIHVIILPFI